MAINENLPSRRGIDVWEQSFAKAGWFIPPFIQSGYISKAAGKIEKLGDSFTQDDLEEILNEIYESFGLASMVLNRFPQVPIVSEYTQTISEAIEAHFFGLHHVAVGGLIPAIEGIGCRLAKIRGLPGGSVRDTFDQLTTDIARESKEKGWGDTDEVAAMMRSFATFARKFLYVNSSNYPLLDGTNRHGISHGSFTDKAYGKPINFFKVIGAVEFLTFCCAFGHNISWMPPNLTDDAIELARRYERLKVYRAQIGAP